MKGMILMTVHAYGTFDSPRPKPSASRGTGMLIYELSEEVCGTSIWLLTTSRKLNGRDICGQTWAGFPVGNARRHSSNSLTVTTNHSFTYQSTAATTLEATYNTIHRAEL